MKELVQSSSSYSLVGDVKVMGKLELSYGDKKKIKDNIKIGVYKDLRKRNLITDTDFQLLVKRLLASDNAQDILQ